MDKKLSFVGQVGSLVPNFWYANIIEMCERLAYFGAKAAAVLYLVRPHAERGLNLGFDDKAVILGVWFFIQCLVPMVSGGYSDRYGYRKSLAVAFVLNILGYSGMANCTRITYWLTGLGWDGCAFWVFLAAACFVGVGTAIFKPPIAGTVARTTTEETSSMGWGIFYWVVNIGGFLAPMGAAFLRGDVFAWENVFYGAAIVTAVNFLPTFLLYKEPDRGKVDTSQGPLDVFVSSVVTMFRDVRLLVFLGLFSCFWLMMLQLWDLMPNFVDQWVDTSDVAKGFGAISGSWVEASGQTKPEMIINLNGFSVILFVLPVSWLIRRLNKVAAMAIGMLVSLIGFVLTGSTSVGLVCCLMIVLFTLGEVTCSPTLSAYVGLIAPKEKKALYMGYSNIPFAVGGLFGNLIAGNVYQQMSNKFNLARDYMVQHLGVAADFVNNKALVPDGGVMQALARLLGGADPQALHAKMGAAYDAVDWGSVAPKDVPGKWADAMDPILNAGGPLDVRGATELLWNTYHPQMIWYWLGLIGLAGTIGMVIFYYATRKSVLGNADSSAGDGADSA